jgi:16S rRNA (cytosine967-C5)-methyltransferase
MIAPARVAAYEILSTLSAGHADLPTAIAHAREALRDERDKALAAEIATGVQRQRAALDYLIAQFAKRPLARLDPEVVDVLRLSAYQLLHLSRVPASAVVDDAVKLTGKIGKRSAGGLVNAVLRALSRSRSTLPLPPRPESGTDRERVLDYLSITLSHPRWLAARWFDRIGLDRAEAWMQFNNRPAPLTLRVNRLRASPGDVQAQLARHAVVTRRGQFAPDALIVDEGHPLRSPEANAGLFVVQDEASQLVTLLAGDHPGPLILDTCASPGGKTTAFAAAAGQEALVVACDVRDRRMALLRHTVQAAGASNVRLVQSDLLEALPFPDQRFTTVIVDAPCSGLGTLRRDPDIRWRRNEADLLTLAEDQRRMLRHAAAVVAPGGRLIYATCSSEPEENERVAETFARESPAFSPVDARTVHPQLPPETIDARGHLRTEPDRHGLECFFGAVFERAADLRP